MSSCPSPFRRCGDDLPSPTAWPTAPSVRFRGRFSISTAACSLPGNRPLSRSSTAPYQKVIVLALPGPRMAGHVRRCVRQFGQGPSWLRHQQPGVGYCGDGGSGMREVLPPRRPGIGRRGAGEVNCVMLARHGRIAGAVPVRWGYLCCGDSVGGDSVGCRGVGITLASTTGIDKGPVPVNGTPVRRAPDPDSRMSIARSGARGAVGQRWVGVGFHGSGFRAPGSPQRHRGYACDHEIRAAAG